MQTFHTPSCKEEDIVRRKEASRPVARLALRVTWSGRPPVTASSKPITLQMAGAGD